MEIPYIFKVGMHNIQPLLKRGSYYLLFAPYPIFISVHVNLHHHRPHQHKHPPTPPEKEKTIILIFFIFITQISGACSPACCCRQACNHLQKSGPGTFPDHNTLSLAGIWAKPVYKALIFTTLTNTHTHTHLSASQHAHMLSAQNKSIMPSFTLK